MKCRVQNESLQIDCVATKGQLVSVTTRQVLFSICTMTSETPGHCPSSRDSGNFTPSWGWLEDCTEDCTAYRHTALLSKVRRQGPSRAIWSMKGFSHGPVVSFGTRFTK